MTDTKFISVATPVTPTVQKQPPSRQNQPQQNLHARDESHYPDEDTNSLYNETDDPYKGHNYDYNRKGIDIANDKSERSRTSSVGLRLQQRQHQRQ